ncbi:MAG: N-acetyltransferase, partial [Candidatus Odinarchaeota archaeon]
YRGRGLGKWLKGAVLLRVKNEFPSVRVVSTGNAASNEPMLDINRRLGFKLYLDMYQYQLELEQLRKYIQRNK